MGRHTVEAFMGTVWLQNITIRQYAFIIVKLLGETNFLTTNENMPVQEISIKICVAIQINKYTK